MAVVLQCFGSLWWIELWPEAISGRLCEPLLGKEGCFHMESVEINTQI